MTINVCILGARGYGAGELLRLLAGHPSARVVAVCSQSLEGEPVTRAHPHLRGFYDRLDVSRGVDLAALADADGAVVFTALPHGESGAAAERMARDAEAAGIDGAVRVIDLSGDLRLRDEGMHRRHYPESPVLSRLRERAVYGLPELNANAVRGARVIANPGCLAIASILACAPLAGSVRSIAIDAKTGSSGSGRSLKETTHHPTRHADFRAYKPLTHQHEPEILQALGDPLGQRLELSFIAQSMDVTRGIFVSAHAELAEPTTEEELRRRYETFYASRPFVRIGEGSPTLQDVVGSNFCDIGLAARGRRVIAMAAIDNLIKGMAGTAIQNMNLMFGLEEATGLWTPSLRPV